MRTTLDDDTNELKASRSRQRALRVATLVLLWLAIMLAVVVVEKALAGV